uniref:Uncharacterized protein n=1 Tax=Ananas comosus var. bracteatus TaxID=296719 RepID=A0A6V7QCE5_ANACO|nr:unnamed protein product [Ananas comosus var. bracteatus]
MPYRLSIGPVSPCLDRSLGSSRKTNVRERSLPHGTVSSCENVLGDRSHPPGTGCLKSCRNTVLRGPVSPIRDRSPKVKTLRTCQNSRDRTFRSEYHLRLSTKCGKVRKSISNTRTSQFAQVQCVTLHLIT